MGQGNSHISGKQTGSCFLAYLTKKEKYCDKTEVLTRKFELH